MTGCVLSVTHRQMCSLYVSLLSHPRRMKMSKRRSVLKSLFTVLGTEMLTIFVKCVGRLTLVTLFYS